MNIDFNSIDDTTYLDYEQMISTTASNIALRTNGNSIRFNIVLVFKNSYGWKSDPFFISNFIAIPSAFKFKLDALTLLVTELLSSNSSLEVSNMIYTLPNSNVGSKMNIDFNSIDDTT